MGQLPQVVGSFILLCTYTLYRAPEKYDSYFHAVHYTVHCAPFVVQRTVLRVGCVFHNAAIRENVLEFILFECLTEPPIERSDWYQNFSFWIGTKIFLFHVESIFAGQFQSILTL